MYQPKITLLRPVTSNRVRGAQKALAANAGRISNDSRPRRHAFCHNGSHAHNSTSADDDGAVWERMTNYRASSDVYVVFDDYSTIARHAGGKRHVVANDHIMGDSAVKVTVEKAANGCVYHYRAISADDGPFSDFRVTLVVADGADEGEGLASRCKQFFGYAPSRVRVADGNVEQPWTRVCKELALADETVAVDDSRGAFILNDENPFLSAVLQIWLCGLDQWHHFSTKAAGTDDRDQCLRFIVVHIVILSLSVAFRPRVVPPPRHG